MTDREQKSPPDTKMPPSAPVGTFDHEEYRRNRQAKEISSHESSRVPRKYLPVDISCLEFENVCPCDLYLKNHRDQYALFAQRGLSLGAHKIAMLRENGIAKLYIDGREDSLYYRYLRDFLWKTVRSVHCPSRRKAEVVHAACHDVMDRVFQDPRAPFLEHAEEIIHTTVSLVVDDDDATRFLVHMTRHDAPTFIHSTNVGIFATALARVFFGNDARRELRRTGTGFFMHDLGKCQVPLSILYKREPLSEEDWHIIRAHPSAGCDMLAGEGFLSEEAKIIILQHHERDDGRGYPFYLTAGDIHPYARICRMADVFEALTSTRPYRERMSTFDALRLMKEKIFTDIDRDLFAHFVRLFS